MNRLKTALVCALLASLTGVGVQAILFLRAATETARALPGVVSAELQATRGELLKQVSGLRADTVSIASHLVEVTDQRTADIVLVANSRLSGVQETLDVLRGDLRPVLANAATLEANYAALARDAQDSLDDSYWDLKSVINSAAVAATSVAQASEAVRDAAPKVAESVVSIGESSAAIASDVRREVDEATEPKKLWQKLLGPFYTVGRLVAAFL